MQNLAGNKDCDGLIQSELQRSHIDTIHGERRESEVPASITGKLGPFTFVRAWYYWIVNGPVPLTVARELYANPVGVTDIRVAGHCGCPPPERPWITVITLDGRHVIDSQERERIEKLFRNVVDREEFERDNVFSDHIAAVGAQEFVMSYHIDSEVGLRLFADTIRKYSLDKC
jgi:hypothetical protein